MRSRLAPLAILWCAAIAGWLLQDVMAPTDAAADREWVGLLPSPWWLAVGVGVATGAGVLARPTLARVLPLALTALLVVPWLPLPIPPVFLALVGRGGRVAAVAIVVVWMVGCLPIPSRIPAFLSNPRSAPIVAGAMATVLFGVSAWRVAPMLPGGDEPHYLVTTQSLLHDGDLTVENNYRQRDYRQFIEIELHPNFWRRGQDGEIYSIHVPGIAALVLPAFAIGGHTGVVSFLVLVAGVGMGLVWQVTWEVTRSAAASWFAWAAGAVSTPILFQAFTVGPDGPAGVLVVVGVWALLRASRRSAERDERGGRRRSVAAALLPWLAIGAALAVLPWLHVRLAPLAGVLGLLLVWQLVRRPGGMARACAFLATPAVSAAAWFWYFFTIYGDARPDAPYRGSNLNAWTHMPSGLGGLFLDHQFGVIPNAPIFIVCVIGLGVMVGTREWRRRPGVVWLAAGITALVSTYVLAISPMRMWWAGWSAPARFAAPFLPALAVAAGVAWQSARFRVTRATLLVALGTSASITGLLVIVARGRFAYNTRDAWGLLFEWLSPMVALPRGMPSFHRLPEHDGFYHAAIWLAFLVAAWLALRRLELSGRPRSRAGLATVVPCAYGVAAMAAISTVWLLTGATVVRAAPAQLRLLRQIELATNDLAVRFTPLRFVSQADVPPLLRIRTSARWLTGRDAPFFILPGGIPAGAYRLHVSAAPSSGEWIEVGVGREWFPMVSRPLPEAGGPFTVPLEFVVDVRAILVRGTGGLGAAVRDLFVEPVVVRPDRRRGSRQAQQVIGYSSGTSYFLDDRALVDWRGFWVRCGEATEVVIAPRRQRARARLMLRNAPVDNQARLETGRWALDLELAPNESRRVDVPLLPLSGPPRALTIGVTSGVRPVDIDVSSQDRRCRGLRVTLR